MDDTEENKFDDVDVEPVPDGGNETSLALTDGEGSARSNDEEEPDKSDGDVDNCPWLPLTEPCIDVADTIRGGRDEEWKSC